MLECMVPAVTRAAGTFGPPRRMVFVYMPNGMHMPDWTPKAAGALGELPATLQPLAPFKSNVQVLSGLAHVNARALGDGAGDHARANACFLTGVHPRKTAGADIHVGVSADQIAAQQIGKNTRLPSLELTCDNSGRQAGSCDSGYACAYQNNISWRNENTPMPPLYDPRLDFRAPLRHRGRSRTRGRPGAARELAADRFSISCVKMRERSNRASAQPTAGRWTSTSPRCARRRWPSSST